MRAIAAGVSDVGLQREHNEDCFAVVPKHELFIVADGMGGHRAGDVASRLASESIRDFFSRTESEDVTWPFHFDTELSEEENRLLTAIRLANRQIYEHSVRSSDLRGMGTTVVGALFSPEKQRMFIGHVGDSRAYRVRGGEIKQLTRDHSLLNDYLAAMPDMPDEQKSELPKNVITRALGMQDSVEVDLLNDEVEGKDVYLLCSDGLSGMVTDEDMLAVVEDLKEPRLICDRLITMANEHGGEDNVTAVVVRIADGTGGEPIGFAPTQEMPTVGEVSALAATQEIPSVPPSAAGFADSPEAETDPATVIDVTLEDDD